ncbi:MAG TPA: PH domain-containing protein [Candidatus Dormibacteraeota bacterium]|jgi:membrane protein YdbS with pleckstrin-like domain
MGKVLRELEARIEETKLKSMTDPIVAVIPPVEDWQRPSPRFSTMRRVQALVATAAACLLAAAITVVRLITKGSSSLPIAALTVLGILLAGFVLDRFLQRRVRAWAYCEREEDLLVRRGVMISRLSVIPYGRMQFIDVVSGPVERLFGLATVRMHTAAAASGARIPGLGAESAASLRDHLAALGESNLAGL